VQERAIRHCWRRVQAVASILPEQAGEQLGFLDGLASVDNLTSSALTQQLLGWKPEQPR
jgi:hypothetical protein